MTTTAIIIFILFWIVVACWAHAWWLAVCYYRRAVEAERLLQIYRTDDFAKWQDVHHPMHCNNGDPARIYDYNPTDEIPLDGDRP